MEQEILPPLKRKRPPRGKKAIDYDRLRTLAARGLTKPMVAVLLGICPNTFKKRYEDDPKFLEAFERGVAEGVAAVTGQLLKCINEGNITGIMFYLKCKAGWKETNIIQHQTFIKIPGADCTMEEAEASYAAAMRMIDAPQP